MKKVLITGANGFIGSSLLEKFAATGYMVEGWDISSGVNSGIEIRKVDLGNINMVKQRLELFYPDIIIHCAGSADVGNSVKKPETDFYGNVTLTHHLLFALHQLGFNHSRIVFLSSAAVYGNPERLPITEDMKVNPLSPYALHKVMCEDICHYFVRNYGMDIKIARIFSAYGKGLRKQIFWDMFRKIQTSGRLDMFGNGNESRDYIHVDDVIQSVYLLATSLDSRWR